MFFIVVILLALTIIFAIAAFNSERHDIIYMLCTMFFCLTTLVVLDIAVSEISCAKTWNMSNTPSQYSVMTGCMIKIDDKWIPARNYREFED
jgi:hypothetical protein